MDAYEVLFMETKEKYNWLRENERRKIISFMKEKGMKVSYQGGKGHFDYTNSGQLEKSYDLTNWKWVEMKKENKKIFISLQAFDKDKGSKNYHVLMDRIGVCVYDVEEKNPNYFNLMRMTSLELPLSESDLNELWKIVVSLSNENI